MAVETAELERILNRVHEWTRNADVKTDILTATQAAVVVVLIPGINALMAEPSTTIWYEAGLVTGCGLLLLALSRSVLALFPRTDKSSWWRSLWSGAPRPYAFRSVTFFGHIAEWRVAEYRARVNAMTADELREDYITQIHTSAVIAARKHFYVKQSIQLFSIGLCAIAVAYLRLRGWF